MIKNHYDDIIENLSEAYDSFAKKLFKKLIALISVGIIFLIVECCITIFKLKHYYYNIFLLCEYFIFIIFVFLSIKFVVWMRED